MTIRRAGSDDVADLFRVRTSVSENLLTTEQLARMGITEMFVAEMLGRSPCGWVAEDQGQIVGFSMINAENGSIFALFVLPSHEGRGIGTKLMQVAEKALFQRHDEGWLETGKTTRAADFYRRLGWGNEQDAGEGSIRLTKRRP